MAALFDWLGNLLSSAITFIFELLPKSPFSYISASPEISKILGYFNFFIPVSSMLAIFVPWLAAIAIYYGISTLLRWAKTIE